MSKIEISSVNGDCVFKKNIYLVDKSGLSVIFNGDRNYVYIQQDNINEIYKLPDTEVVVPKAKIFQKQQIKEVTIMQCSKRGFSAKGFTSKMHFDSTYSNASIDIKMPYDIVFNIEDVEQFILFADNFFKKKSVDYLEVFEYVELDINNIIKNVVGNSGIYVIEDLETNTLELEEEIIKLINGSDKIKKIGLHFEKITIQIVDDYEHRLEKKIVQKNKQLYR